MHEAAAAAFELTPEPAPETEPARPRSKVIACRAVRLVTKDGQLVELDTDEVEVFPIERKRGFAALSPAQRRLIGAKGGSSAQAKGGSNRFTSATASLAGKKGGLAPHRQRGRLKASATPDEG